jgi:hypothetical protein
MATWPDPRAEQHMQGATEHVHSGTRSSFRNYQSLVSRVTEVFGDEIRASRWLSLPNRDLNGQTPLEAAQQNGYDAQILEPILIRIEHGVDY